MTLTREKLLKIEPAISVKTADRWLAPLNAAMVRAEANTPERMAAFLGQVLHESANLSATVENLNYRPQALMSLFRGRFTPQQAAEFGFVPGKQSANREMIANIAYASRYGNGDVVSGDGWRYRGRGPIQLTFKDNYQLCGEYLGLDLLSRPEMVEQPEVGCLAAAWFWVKGNRTGKSLNKLADLGRIADISNAVNGGDNGLVERFNITKHAVGVLA